MRGWLLALGLVSPAWGAFQEAVVGARPLGMGGAFVAVADDANGLLWNPAGLAEVARPELTGTSSALYGIRGLTQNHLGIAVPVPRLATLGAGWLGTGYDGLYAEDAIMVAAGRRVGEWTALGVGFRYLRWSAPGYERLGDPTYLGPVSALGYEAGATLRPIRSLTFGVRGRDLNEPAVSLLRGSPEPDRIPAQWQVGAAFRPGEGILLAGAWRPSGPAGPALADRLRVGAEAGVAGTVAFRLGMYESRPTAGIGLKASHVQMDVGTLFHDDLGAAFRVSVTVRR